MGIILTILGIIGKVLLVIVMIVLALLLLLAFVPFRYELSGVKEGEKADATARVTWLLHAVSIRANVSKEDGNPWQKDLELKLFGISPGKIRKNRAEKKKSRQKERKKKKIEEIRAKDPEKYEELRQEALKRRQERAEEKKREEEAERARREEEKKEEKAAENKKKRRALKQSHRRRRAVYWIRGVVKGLERIAEGIGRLFTFAYELPARLSEKIGDLFRRTSSIYDTIHTWIVFLADPRFFETLKLTGSSLKKLWKKIGPKRLTGDVTYGLEDPSATGKILAAASAVFPVYGPDFILHPDFETKRLDGRVNLSGRIYLGSVLFLIGRFLLNHNTRYTIQFLKQRKEKKDG